MKKPLSILLKAIELKPDSKVAYQNRSNVYLKIRHFIRAIADYTELLKQHPDDPEVYFGRGVVDDDKGDLDLAIEDYNTAIKLKPDDAEAYFNYGTYFS